MKHVRNGAIKMEANFTVEKSSIPHGEVDFQELELRLIWTEQFYRKYFKQHSLEKIRWLSNEFNEQNQSSEKTVQDLILGAFYKPIFRIHASINGTNAHGGISTLIHQCPGEVKLLSLVR